jgi:hypothetical protein
MKNSIFLFIACYIFANIANAQLQINTPITLTGGAVITVQDMNVNATQNIDGNGTLQLTGIANTNLNFNGNQLPILELNKTSSDVSLSSNVTAGDVILNGGKLILNTSNLNLTNNASISGSATNYVVVNNSGLIVKNLNSNLIGFNLPVGPSISAYNPISISTSGAYSGAFFTASVKNGVHPNNPSNPDHLNVYWPITRTGITGSLSANGTYNDPTNIVGIETNIKGADYQAIGWDFTGSNANNTLNTVTANIPSTGGDLFGTNTFAYLKSKAFLQGAYNAPTLNMRDQLHAVLPASDPYRSAPYNTAFVHVNNPTVETSTAAVLTATTNGGNNIVDWVFLQVRNNSGITPGGTVVATRAALIQKDGDIVDMDGTSPVIFRNLPNGVAYTIAVRHRNHLAMCTDPATNLITLEAATSPSTIDFTTMTDAQIFGPVSSFKKIGVNNMLIGGNSKIDAKVSFNGLNNDKDPINANLTSAVYRLTDLNMNVSSTRTGLNNDKDFLLINVLNSIGAASVNQSLP